MVGTYCRKSRGGETGEEMVEDRKTTNRPAVESERPKHSASSWEIPMIRNALVYTGAPAQRGEQYFIRLRAKALFVVRSSGGSRNDFA